MKRNIYLNKLSLKEAHDKFNKVLYKNKLNLPIEGELIFAVDSLTRVTAEPVFAKISSPYFQSAAMDGIVVKAEITFGASESTPVKLKKNLDFYYINTGNIIPQGFNAVIKIEDINIVNKVISQNENQKRSFFKKADRGISEEIEIYSAAFPGQHIRNIGEDIVANQLILSVNHKIRPVDIGGLLAGGISELLVRKKPRIGIIPTGDELIEPGEKIFPGKIIEYNSKVIKNMISEWGGEASIFNIVRDIPNDLISILKKVIQQSDIVVVLAGSSAGSKDFTSKIIQSLGEILVHGVTIMPGKPTILGIIDKIPVIGLPGYPVSMFISAEQFLKPLIFKKLGLQLKNREMIKAAMAQKVVSRLGNEEFLRVRLGEIDEKIMAFPLPRGAGIINSLIEADAFIRIPSLKEGLDYQEEVNAELMHNLTNIKNNIIVTGSHDLILDVLKNELQKNISNLNLVSFNVGSMGGLLALKQRKTHLATSHLLDPENGEYNFSYIKRILPHRELKVINLAYREQGIMVKKGNPKNIKSIDDLVKKDITFVNRQKGSGTRVLLDYLLKGKGYNPLRIKGYSREEYTHLMVASSVAEGNVDAGLGILSAAKAFYLDFIPIAKERYDIILSLEFYSNWKMKEILQIIRSENFQKKVLDLGGYDLTLSGKEIKNESIN